MQSDHALEARGCDQERAKVVPRKERRNHESSVHPAERWPRIRGARCGIGRARADGPGALQVGGRSGTLVSGAKDAFDLANGKVGPAIEGKRGG